MATRQTYLHFIWEDLRRVDRWIRGTRERWCNLLLIGDQLMVNPAAWWITHQWREPDAMFWTWDDGLSVPPSFIFSSSSVFRAFAGGCGLGVGDRSCPCELSSSRESSDSWDWVDQLASRSLRSTENKGIESDSAHPKINTYTYRYNDLIYLMGYRTSLFSIGPSKNPIRNTYYGPKSSNVYWTPFCKIISHDACSISFFFG